MRGPNLTTEQRQQIGTLLLSRSCKMKPERGLIQKLVTKFAVDRRTISQMWRRARVQDSNDEQISWNTLPKSGRKSLVIPTSEIVSLDRSKRTTIWKLALAIGVSKTTVLKWVKKGEVNSHTSAIKPDLTIDNKYLRLNFVLKKLKKNNSVNNYIFKEMSNIVHIDEKWFNMTNAEARYYLGREEDEVYRSCKSKRFITKVMFMAAVSRPIYDSNGVCLFDGKIGCFPFTYQEPAQRSSKNRPAGTMVTKPIASITKNVTRSMLIEHVLPAIKEKWPTFLTKDVVIQQDNAKPHINGTDPEFLEHSTSDGWRISLINQPPNSSDLNVLDLGFFRSLQSLQITKPASTTDKLVINVLEAWNEEKDQTLNDVWLSLHACMIEVLKSKGHNDYKLPHLKKNTQRRMMTLPRNLDTSLDLVKETCQHLISVGKTSNLEDLITELGLDEPVV